MSLQVTPQQSLALVEYIAHLSVQDWNAVTGDLQRLGTHFSVLVNNTIEAGSQGDLRARAVLYCGVR